MPRLASLPLATAAFIFALAASASAQDYPTRPIRMIIPFPPGGGSDVTGRVVATALGERLGKQVIVDNRAGAEVSSAPSLRPMRRRMVIRC